MCIRIPVFHDIRRQRPRNFLFYGDSFFWQPPVGIISRKALTKTPGTGAPQSPFAPGPYALAIRPWPYVIMLWYTVFKSYVVYRGTTIQH